MDTTPEYSAKIFILNENDIVKTLRIMFKERFPKDAKFISMAFGEPISGDRRKRDGKATLKVKISSGTFERCVEGSPFEQIYRFPCDGGKVWNGKDWVKCEA